jgi:nitrate reductase NapE component
LTGAGAGAPAAERRRRFILFAVVEAAFVLLVLLPGLIYVLVLANGLSESQLILYALGLLALQAVVTGLLLWMFRIIPGPQSGRPDAR